MKNILKQEFREELIANMIEAGISKNSAAKIVNNKYEEALISVTSEYLKHVAKLIENKEYYKVSNLLAFSDPGDIGNANYYINFSEITGFEDIGDIVEELKRI